jgi:hypothetical protein
VRERLGGIDRLAHNVGGSSAPGGGFVESTVNPVISKRFCKRQQMQWTKRGAHLLLQTRVKTLNQERGAVFQCWYPDLQLEEKPLAA